MKTVVGLFDNYEDAEHALKELTNGGFRRSSICITTTDQAVKNHLESRLGKEPSPTLRGLIVGGVLGLLLFAILLILIGLGVINLPGDANPFATAEGVGGILTLMAIGMGIGLVAGAIIGVFVGARIPKKDSNFFAEGVSPGTVLVAVETKNNRAVEALSMMRLRPPEPRVPRRSESRYGNLEVTTNASESYPKLSG